MSPNRRRAIGWLAIVLPLLATAILLLLLGRAGWGQFLDALRAADPRWLGAALVCAFLVELAKGWRWRILLGAGRAQAPALLAILLESRLLNTLAPLRAGEAWRIAAVARAQGRTVATGGVALGLEKACDAAALALVALLVLGTIDLDRRWLLVGAIGLVGAAALLVALRRRTGLRERLRREIGELRHLRRPWVPPAVALLTAIGIGLGIVVNALALRATGIAGDAALAAAILLAGYAIGLLPSAPGQLGVYELAVAAPLIAAGYPADRAIAAALALHLVLLAQVALGGLVAAAIRLVARRRATADETPRDKA